MANERKSGKWTLWIIAVVSVLPVLGSYLLYELWRPDSRMNHGQLVDTRPLAMAQLVNGANGQALPGPGLKGKWVLLTVQGSRCEDRCRTKLYYMRQVRTATNENMERIERVWLVSDSGTPAPAILAEHPGLWTARAPAADWLAALPNHADGSSIYLIDPLGNIVLRYGDKFDPKGMLKDLNRLLKYSRIG